MQQAPSARTMFPLFSAEVNNIQHNFTFVGSCWIEQLLGIIIETFVFNLSFPLRKKEETGVTDDV